MNQRTSAAPPAHIFREYDVRGIVGDDLTADLGERLGRAFASELRSRHDGAEGLTIALGHDNRPSSPALATAISRGATGASRGKARVASVSVCTSPPPSGSSTVSLTS